MITTMDTVHKSILTVTIAAHNNAMHNNIVTTLKASKHVSECEKHIHENRPMKGAVNNIMPNRILILTVISKIRV